METKDKILIVEDDETIAALLIAVLEANGFDTIRILCCSISVCRIWTAWRSSRGSASGPRCR